MTRRSSGLFSQLYVQGLIGMTIGGFIGSLWPRVGPSLRPTADGFVKRIEMLPSPIISGTVVVGMARRPSPAWSSCSASTAS